jgi:hypothetical protein
MFVISEQSPRGTREAKPRIAGYHRTVARATSTLPGLPHVLGSHVSEGPGSMLGY